MPNELYRDYIDGKADEIINSLGGTITPAPANAELYRDFLDRKFDDVINAIGNLPNIKSFTYTGTGTVPNTINFPNKPKIILGIFGQPDSTTIDSMNSCVWGAPRTSIIRLYTNINVNIPERSMITSYSGNSITLQGENSVWSLNITNVIYTVYYI